MIKRGEIMKKYDDYIYGEKVISIPMLQEKHNLTYLKAKETIEEMQNKKLIVKGEGYSYIVVDEDKDDDDWFDDDFFDSFLSSEQKIDKITENMKDEIFHDDNNIFPLIDIKYTKDLIVKISFEENEDGTFAFTDNGYTIGKLIVKTGVIPKEKNDKIQFYLKKYNIEMINHKLYFRFKRHHDALAAFIHLYSIMVLINNL